MPQSSANSRVIVCQPAKDLYVSEKICKTEFEGKMIGCWVGWILRVVRRICPERGLIDWSRRICLQGTPKTQNFVAATFQRVREARVLREVPRSFEVCPKSSVTSGLLEHGPSLLLFSTNTLTSEGFLRGAYVIFAEADFQQK